MIFHNEEVCCNYTAMVMILATPYLLRRSSVFSLITDRQTCATSLSACTSNLKCLVRSILKCRSGKFPENSQQTSESHPTIWGGKHTQVLRQSTWLKISIKEPFILTTTWSHILPWLVIIWWPSFPWRLGSSDGRTRLKQPSRPSLSNFIFGPLLSLSTKIPYPEPSMIT